MRRILAAALAAALSLPVLALASDEAALPTEQVFSLADGTRTANRFEVGARGTLVVEPDGRVSEVELDMSGPAGAAYRKAIEAWTFKPVEIDGRVVRAKAHFVLSAFGESKDGSNALELGIENVWFLDPSSDGGPAIGPSSHLQPPRYPSRAAVAGFGATVDVLVKLDAEGRVVDAGVLALALDTKEIRERGRAETYARQFAEAAVGAARAWTLRDPETIAGGSAIIPVVFHPPQRPMGSWRPQVPVDVTLLPWMVVVSAEAVSMTSSGGVPSSRFELVSDVAGTLLN